jgi:hypothetical protein
VKNRKKTLPAPPFSEKTGQSKLQGGTKNQRALNGNADNSGFASMLADE